MYCQNCGKSIPDDAKFCTFCGSRIEHTVDTPKEPIPRRDFDPAPKKKNILPVILVILAIAAVIAVIVVAVPRLMNKEGSTSSKKKTEESSETDEEESKTAKSKTSKENSSKKDSSKSLFPEKGESSVDKSTLFENQTKTSFLVYYDNSLGTCVVDPYGRLYSFGQYAPDLSPVADNGALAGTVYVDDTNEMLFLIKDGSMITLVEGEEGSITDFALSKSGEKLIYLVSGTGLYSYDTESGDTEALEEGEASDDYSAIWATSYHGNVIMFSRGRVSISWINNGKPFWATPFASFIGSSDDGGHIYYNSSYRTSSGNKTDNGHYENEEYSVDFCETVVPNDYDPDSSVFPESNTIMTSESIQARILAHTSDYSEILFGYDGDTYYYKDQEKTRLTTNALMIPVESLAPFSLDYYSSWYESLINEWHNTDPGKQEYINNELVLYGDGEFYDTDHSLKSLKNQVYLQFNESTFRTVSMVWLDEELQETNLIDDITTEPVLSNDGTKIWCISGTEMYCVDLSSGEPEVFSSYIGETIYNYEAPYPAPIAVGEDGETVYYLTDFRLVDYEESDYVSSADLYLMTFDAMDSPRLIDTNVFFLKKGPQGQICYLKDWELEEEYGTLYRYNEQDGSKEQIAMHVRDFYVLNGVLFYLVTQENDYDNLTLRRQDSSDSSQVISNEVDYIEEQVNGIKGY